MSFSINVQPCAAADLMGIHGSLSAYSEPTANRTYFQILGAIEGLADLPRRYALAPESERCSVETRHMIVGNYRVIYQILAAKVEILRIMHAAQLPLSPIELM